MTKPVSVDFQFAVQQRGRGAKKQIVENTAQSDESKPTLERIPRISRFMALAIHFEDLIKQGVVTDYADLARLGHVTRARVTQIMNLRLLASEIQEELLFLRETKTGNGQFQLRAIQAIAAEFDWKKQRNCWGRISS
jgi:hypothetical protein